MRLKGTLILLAGALCLALPVGVRAEGNRDQDALFQYDAAQPLAIEEKAVRTRDGITEHDITFASPKGGRVSAFLLVPAGKGPFAGMIFMHGATGTRRSLLPGARLCCAAGAVCLLLDAPYCGDRTQMGKRLTDIKHPEQMRAAMIQLVIDLRRGIDLLRARPDVDPKRLGYVGASVGGAVGGILAAVDKRIAAYALISAAGNWQEAALKTRHPLAVLARAMISKQEIERGAALLAPIDPVRFVGRAAPSALLFQNGLQDATTPETCARAYQEAASNPKECRWYDAGHDLNLAAFTDRMRWFQERIGLGAVATPSSLKGLNH